MSVIKHLNVEAARINTKGAFMKVESIPVIIVTIKLLKVAPLQGTLDQST